MQWTERMQDVLTIDEGWQEKHGQPPTLAELGRELGLSRERVRQLRLKIERYRRFPRQADAHVRRWRQLFMAVLPLLVPPRQRRQAIVKPAEPAAHVWRWRAEQAARARAAVAAEAEARQRRRQTTERQLRAQLAAALAADPRLRQLDQLARQMVRKENRI